MGYAVAAFGDLKWTAKERVAFEASTADGAGIEWPDEFARTPFEREPVAALLARLAEEGNIGAEDGEFLRVEPNARRLRVRAYLNSQSFEDLGRALAALVGAAALAGATGGLLFMGIGEGLYFRARASGSAVVVEELADAEATAIEEDHPALAEILDEFARSQMARVPLPGLAQPVESKILERLAGLSPEALIRAAEALKARSEEARKAKIHDSFAAEVLTTDGKRWMSLAEAFPDGRTLLAALRRGSKDVGPWARAIRFGAALTLLTEVDRALADTLAIELLASGTLNHIAAPLLGTSPRAEAVDALFAAVERGIVEAGHALATSQHAEVDARVLAAFEVHARRLLTHTHSDAPQDLRRAVGGYVGIVEARKLAAAIPLLRAIDQSLTLSDPLGWVLVRLGDVPPIDEIGGIIKKVDDLTSYALMDYVVAQYPDRAFDALSPRLVPPHLDASQYVHRLSAVFHASPVVASDPRWAEPLAPFLELGDTTCQLNALGALSPLPRAEAMLAMVRHLAGMHVVTLAYAIKLLGDAAFLAEKERRPARERKSIEKALAQISGKPVG